MLKIEKGIPVPKSLRDEVQEAFEKMLVGDSFVTALDAKKLIERIAENNKIGIVVAPENHGQIRVWRVEARPEKRKRGRPPKEFYVKQA